MLNYRFSQLDTCLRVASGALLLLCLAALPAGAGELALSWAPSNDELTAGYEVEVEDASGRVVQVVDVKEETRALVDRLNDEAYYTFRVWPYDKWGARAGQASGELKSMPAPRIDQLDQLLPLNGGLQIDLIGANFSEAARVAARREGWVIVSSTLVAPGRLRIQVKPPASGETPLPADFLVLNPVRRADAYFTAHPEVLDVDQSGKVDHLDLDLVVAAFGFRNGEARFRPELDLNGDGIVDGEDQAPLRRHLAAVASDRP